jgi:hypothetical protein
VHKTKAGEGGEGADLDFDLDADLADFAAFQLHFGASE